MTALDTPSTRALAALWDGPAVADLPDGELLARFAAEPGARGDLAFEALVRRHGPMVRGVCRRALADPSDADDAFQATFLVLVRRAGSVRVDDSLGRWLFGVSRRVARRARLDRDRRRRREGNGPVPDRPDPAAGVPPRSAALEALATLDDEVARLAEPFRSAVVLCDLGGRTIEQAALEVGCPPGTIKSRLHRGRDRLLARRGFGGCPPAPSLVAPAPPPDGLVAALVARAAPLARSAVGWTLIPRWFPSPGASRMMNLLATRWLATVALTSALAAVGTTALQQPRKPTLVSAYYPRRSGEPLAPAQTPQPRPTPTPTDGPAPDAARPVPTEFSKTATPLYVIEPPDMIVVEVLQALPGRPITGEHLVRPDGRISLGFYGEIHVSGLDITEVKEKVVLHLLKYLNRDALGLVKPDPNDPTRAVPIAPADTGAVFVDVTSYNSKNYYVEGDVHDPARLPVTGNETVLDALHFAGGLLFNDPGRAQALLVRPAPPGVAAAGETKLPVELKAIELGDTRTNYQMRHGDRLVIRRDPTLTDEEASNGRLDVQLRAQQARIDKLEQKLDRILEKLNTPPQPAK